MVIKFRKTLVLKVLSVMMLVLAAVPTAFALDPGLINPNTVVNDDFEKATALVLNQTFQTTGQLSFATVDGHTENSADNLTSCDMRRTVWYTFSAPFDGNIALSTQGSYISLDNDEYSQDTKIAVYTGSTLANLVQVACNDDNTGALGEISSVNIVKGTTYYVRVGLFNNLNDNVTGGFYKLTSVILEATNYDPAGLENGSFWIPSNSINFGWKLKNNFNGDGTLAEQFKFIGGPAESTSLVQKATWKSDELVARVNHLLQLDVEVVTVGTPNFKIGLIVLYSDGTPASKSTLKMTSAFNGNADLGVFFASPNVDQVKVVMKNAGAAGTSVTVDYVKLDYDGGLFKTEAAPVAPLALPLP